MWNCPGSKTFTTETLYQFLCRLNLLKLIYYNYYAITKKTKLYDREFDSSEKKH